MLECEYLSECCGYYMRLDIVDIEEHFVNLFVSVCSWPAKIISFSHRVLVLNALIHSKCNIIR